MGYIQYFNRAVNWNKGYIEIYRATEVTLQENKRSKQIIHYYVYQNGRWLVDWLKTGMLLGNECDDNRATSFYRQT